MGSETTLAALTATSLPVRLSDCRQLASQKQAESKAVSLMPLVAACCCLPRGLSFISHSSSNASTITPPRLPYALCYGCSWGPMGCLTPSWKPDDPGMSLPARARPRFFFLRVFSSGSCSETRRSSEAWQAPASESHLSLSVGWGFEGSDSCCWDNSGEAKGSLAGNVVPSSCAGCKEQEEWPAAWRRCASKPSVSLGRVSKGCFAD